MENKDYKTISFCKFALAIGAIKEEYKKGIDINDLLFKSFFFLMQDKVLTKKQELEYNIFKDRYNRYLEFCIENDLVDKNSFQKVESLNITAVPDMSKIDVPDISKELEEMGIDLDKLVDVFSKVSK